MKYNNVTLVITSCGRLDLLHDTIESLLSKVDFDNKIIIDDSADKKIHHYLKEKYSNQFDLILNKKNLGQIRSIDIAYNNVKTEYIFHCEDDWRFYGNFDFINESINILDTQKNISMVSLRDWENDVLCNCNLDILKEESNFYILKSKNHKNWGGYSFNPGLRRNKDYKDIQFGFQSIGHEEDISNYFLKNKMHIALLKKSAVEHIGWDSHIISKNNPNERFYLLKKLLPRQVISLIKKYKI
ncbi:TPA: glycosyltransferase [Proteus mirabilis]|nr:glycosyltransferase [Proteus mirabilis]HEJ9639289.1 glycosyltransferase [Proteus mirabilis]